MVVHPEEVCKTEGAEGLTENVRAHCRELVRCLYRVFQRNPPSAEVTYPKVHAALEHTRSTGFFGVSQGASLRARRSNAPPSANEATLRLPTAPPSDLEATLPFPTAPLSDLEATLRFPAAPPSDLEATPRRGGARLSSCEPLLRFGSAPLSKFAVPPPQSRSLA